MERAIQSILQEQKSYAAEQLLVVAPPHPALLIPLIGFTVHPDLMQEPVSHIFRDELGYVLSAKQELIVHVKVGKRQL